MANKSLKGRPTGRDWGAGAYQELARRTQNIRLTHDQTLRHALFGIVSEAGEIMSLYQHQIQEEKGLELSELKKEIGDLLWFVCELLDVYELSLPDVMALNIEKLKHRYPDGFDTMRSKARHEFDRMMEVMTKYE